MIISITGTPGTGKTYIAKKIALASKNSLKYFDLNECIKDNKLYDSYDKKDKTYDVDTELLKKKFNKVLKKEHSENIILEKLVGKSIKIKEFIKTISSMCSKKRCATGGIILDSHLSHYLNSDYCIIVRSDIKTLNKRLKARKYSATKIKDNIESEIFQVCLDEARKLKRNIIIVEN